MTFKSINQSRRRLGVILENHLENYQTLLKDPSDSNSKWILVRKESYIKKIGHFREKLDSCDLYGTPFEDILIAFEDKVKNLQFPYYHFEVEKFDSDLRFLEDLTLVSFLYDDVMIEKQKKFYLRELSAFKSKLNLSNLKGDQFEIQLNDFEQRVLRLQHPYYFFDFDKFECTFNLLNYLSKNRFGYKVAYHTNLKKSKNLP